MNLRTPGMLLGAEFTRIWTVRKEGRRPLPEPYAEKQRGVVEKIPGGAVEESTTARA